MGIINKMKEIAAEGQKTLSAYKAKEEARANELAQIIVSTGSINQPYEIIDAVFAMDSHQEGFFSGDTNPAKAFEGVKTQLRTLCHALGGNAVLNCQFEYRVAIGQSIFGNKQCIEIFSYGTAVKLIGGADSKSLNSMDSSKDDSVSLNNRTSLSPDSASTTFHEISFACPKCAQTLKVDKSYAGRIANCPDCNAKIRIPQH